MGGSTILKGEATVLETQTADNLNLLQKKQQWNLQMDKQEIKEHGEVQEEAQDEEPVAKRDIRANLLAARKKQLLRRKRGYGRLPTSLRRG
jgi:hypothetical protein